MRTLKRKYAVMATTGVMAREKMQKMPIKYSKPTTQTKVEPDVAAKVEPVVTAKVEPVPTSDVTIHGSVPTDTVRKPPVPAVTVHEPIKQRKANPWFKFLAEWKVKYAAAHPSEPKPNIIDATKLASAEYKLIPKAPKEKRKKRKRVKFTQNPEPSVA